MKLNFYTIIIITIIASLNTFTNCMIFIGYKFYNHDKESNGVYFINKKQIMHQNLIKDMKESLSTNHKIKIEDIVAYYPAPYYFEEISDETSYAEYHNFALRCINKNIFFVIIENRKRYSLDYDSDDEPAPKRARNQPENE